MDEKELPEGWVETTVSDIADVIEPGFPYGRFNTEGIGVPHLRPMNIDRLGHLSLDEVKYVNVDNPPLLHKGDILFNNTNSPVWVGKTTVITQGELYTFSNHMTRITLNLHAGNPQFFALQLQYMQQLGYFLERCVHHVNQASIASSFLATNVSVSVAPTNEQNRIVAAIEQQFTRLDNAVASLKSAQARTRQYRASLLKSAVEGELTKEWRATHPASETGAQLLTRILAERRKRWEDAELAKMREKGIMPKDSKWKEKYKEPERPNTNDLPGLPEEWCWATVDQVVAYIRNGLSQKPEVSPPGYPILRINAVRPMKVDLEEVRYLPLAASEAQNYFIENGDLLFTRYNGSLDLLGVVGMVRGCSELTLHPDKLIRVKTILKGTFPDYMEIACNVDVSRAFIESRARTTAGQTGISGIDIKQMPIPLPPLAEQEQIVLEVEAALSNIAKLEEATEHSLTRAEHERQSILREAFAGRLVPQDPQDEPASVLLERIRAERKQREESDKIVKAGRREVKMEVAKKRRIRKTSDGTPTIGLYEKLVELGQPVPPEELFKAVGLKTDDQPESTGAYYTEARTDVNDQLIAETRPDDSHILVEALEPPAELLARMQAEEEAAPAKKAELPKNKLQKPTLWDM